MVKKRKKHNKKMHVCKGIRDKGSETSKGNDSTAYSSWIEP